MRTFKATSKILLIIISLILLAGCSAVRIDTKNIDNILSVILTKNNKLFNQVGQGYKYYLPGGVSYIDSDNLNDILYCNGTYYYLYIDAVSYYYNSSINHTRSPLSYYYREIKKEDGFKSSGYLEITKQEDLYYIEFVYNYAKIEAVVEEKNLNDTVLNASYILSTIKYNKNVVELMLDDDYFTNKTGKYDDYNIKDNNGKFQLEKDEETDKE